MVLPYRSLVSRTQVDSQVEGLARRDWKWGWGGTPWMLVRGLPKRFEFCQISSARDNDITRWSWFDDIRTKPCIREGELDEREGIS
eukprot:786932-Amorphochlora_amoeboformis.AAC.3